MTSKLINFLVHFRSLVNERFKYYQSTIPSIIDFYIFKNFGAMIFFCQLSPIDIVIPIFTLV